MAGSSVTQTRETNHRKVKTPPTEVIVTLVCLSDDANGLVPAKVVDGLEDFVITEVWPVPHATTPFTSAFEVRIEETATSGRIFLSGSIAVTSKEALAGNVGSNSGGYPRMPASATMKIVNPADHSTLLNVGNAKTHTIKIRCERK